LLRLVVNFLQQFTLAFAFGGDQGGLDRLAAAGFAGGADGGEILPQADDFRGQFLLRVAALVQGDDIGAGEGLGGGVGHDVIAAGSDFAVPDHDAGTVNTADS